MALGVVGGRRADAERPCVGCWWLLAWFLARRFWSPWWVGAVRSSGALVLAGAAQRGTRRTQFFFVTFRFLLPFLFSVLYFVWYLYLMCMFFVFDVYVICILFVICFICLLCFICVLFCSATAPGENPLAV
jgi:hypothetical protein